MRSRSLFPLMVTMMVLAAGCGQQEVIHSYQVPKQHLVEEANRVEAPAVAAQAAPSATKTPRRTLGAIVLHDAQGWFFKLTGPVAEVGEVVETFHTFLKSVQFKGQEPTWTLPEGWKQLPGGGFRFASIEIPSETKSLDFSISSLPKGDGDEPSYLLSNINRWRGQLQMSPLRPDQLTEESTKLEMDGLTATVVDLEGVGREGGMGQPPFAGGRAVAPAVPPVAGPAAAAGRAIVGNRPAALKFEQPAGWAPGRTSDMRKAAFEVKQGEAKLDITVIDLEPAAGDLLANVNRWRDQVKLGDIDAAQLEQDAKAIEVDGHAGHYVQLVGPERDGKAETILGVVIKVSGRPWFVKLMGDGVLAERERERFEAFVKSIKFNQAGAGDGQ